MKKVAKTHAIINVLLAPLIILAVASKAHSQNEITFYSKEKIKKENGLWGVKRADTWTVPARYDKIEGFGDSSRPSAMACYKGSVIDVYKTSYSQELIVSDITASQLETLKLYLDSDAKVPIVKDKKWSNEADVLTSGQKSTFEMFRTGNIYPYIKNGKWGYATKYNNVSPKYDSLFNICYENLSGTKDCGELIGVSLDGNLGIVETDGIVIILEKDYVKFRYWNADGRNVITCTHKSGTDVTFGKMDGRISGFRRIRYIETKNSSGLLGYVYYGDFAEPKYTSISTGKYPVANFECVLPDGTIEYRNGAELVPAAKIKEYTEGLKKAEALALEKKKFEKEGLTTEFKTRDYIFYAYPGWSSLFKNNEKGNSLNSTDDSKKKASEIFNEAPEGWLKNEDFLYSVYIRFDELESATLTNVKQGFVDMAMRRSGFTREKINLTEEKITLDDGRKAVLLFYVCPDSKGMVSANYFDCKLAIESADHKNTILSYAIFMDGGAPDITKPESVAWKDYFKKVLLTVRPK